MINRSLLVNLLTLTVLAFTGIGATQTLAQPAIDEKPAASNEPVATQPSQEAEQTTTPAEDKKAEQAVSLAEDNKTTIEDLKILIDEQQQKLETQSDLVTKQQKLLADQQDRLGQQKQSIDDQGELLIRLQTQIDQLAAQDKTQSLTEEDVRLRERLEAIEIQVAKNDEDPEQLQDTLQFPGAIRVPGTNAAYRVGGFVKMSMVNSLDPLGSDDRFIVSSIPTESVSSEGEWIGTARFSRTNFDLRQQTSLGIFRAFVEGDFAAPNDTYRLRHAYGQYGPVLAGRTWSTFVDNQASPEEIDFEGINGRINIRQPQIRFFPKIGKSWNLLLGLEDPEVDVTDGDGVSEYPDVVVSVRRTFRERWHLKTSILLRQIQAESISTPMGIEDELGWGVSLSGRTGISRLHEKDQLMFQFNIGDGIGRYINDLESEGGKDAVFDPSDGSLQTLGYGYDSGFG